MTPSFLQRNPCASPAQARSPAVEDLGIPVRESYSKSLTQRICRASLLPRGGAILYFVSKERRSRKEVEYSCSTFLLSLGQSQVTGLNLPSPRDCPVSLLQFDRCYEASKFQLKRTLERGTKPICRPWTVSPLDGVPRSFVCHLEKR